MVRGIAGLGDHLLGDGVGLVLPLPLLVLHHPPLLVELGLGDRLQEMPHPVRLHPERGVEGRGGDVLEIVGAVLVGGAVEIGGPERLERLEVVGVEVLTAVEHQVLEEVREAGAARALVLGTDVVPDVDGHDRRLVILVHQQRQAVFQNKLLVWDRDGRLRRRRRAFGPCRLLSRPGHDKCDAERQCE